MACDAELHFHRPTALTAKATAYPGSAGPFATLELSIVGRRSGENAIVIYGDIADLARFERIAAAVNAVEPMRQAAE